MALGVTGGSDVRLPAGRTAGVLLLAAGLLAFAALGFDELTPGPLWVHAGIAAAGVLGGAALIVRAPSVSPSVLHVAGVAGTALNSVTIAIAGHGWHAYVPFYGWIGLFFALVGSRRALVVQLGILTVGFLAAMAWADRGGAELVIGLWALTAAVVSAGLAYALRAGNSGRLQRELARLRDELETAHATQLREQERYRILVEALPLVAYVDEVDAHASTRFISPQIEALLGYPQQDWFDDPELWIDLLHPDDRDDVLRETQLHNETGAPFRAEYRLRAADGRWVWFADEARVELDADGLPVASHGYMLDVTEQKAMEEQLSFQAFHDPLTGLANRARFHERIAAARDHHGADRVGLVYVDLDDFKSVNDALGHEAGDEVLVAAAARLRGTVRADDTVARLGGDEFAVLMQDVDEAGVLELARRVAARLGEPIEVAGAEVLVSASVGVSFGATGGGTGDVIQQADLAMYAAKQRGKGRVEIYSTALASRSSDRLALRTDLRRAIAGDDLDVALQPIVDLRTMAIVGAEALARWNHPERGPVPPSEFVPVAEEGGFVVELGRWALREAAAAAAGLRATHGDRFFVSVNLSARDLLEDDLGAAFRAAMTSAGLAPGNLVAELTETALLADPDLAALRLFELRDAGVRIAIDDFGTGYSSLSYLAELPIDVLKIARPFVAAIDGGRRDERLASAVVSMARDLDLQVIAEGIETPVQAQRLREDGCDLGQGFLFAVPAPLAAFPTAGALVDGRGRSAA